MRYDYVSDHHESFFSFAADVLNNLVLSDVSYPEFLPYSPHEFDFDDEDYPRPEEGFPGESGSAGARDHGKFQNICFQDHFREKAAHSV